MGAELNRGNDKLENWRDARTDKNDFCLCGMHGE